MTLRVRALLIEGNSYDAKYVLEILSDFKLIKVRVEHVKTLAEATATLLREKFDVIILDLHLPDSDGINTVHQVKLMARGSGILILTGSNCGELKTEALQAGASEYLAKCELKTGRLPVQIMSVLVESQMNRHLPETGFGLGSAG